MIQKYRAPMTSSFYVIFSEVTYVYSTIAVLYVVSFVPNGKQKATILVQSSCLTALSIPSCRFYNLTYMTYGLDQKI